MNDDLDVFKKEWNALADPLALLRAIVQAYEHLDAAGEQPGREMFSNNHHFMERHGMPHVRRFWADDTGRDQTEFPWDTWFVMYTWTSWRKALAPIKQSAKSRLGLATLFDRAV